MRICIYSDLHCNIVALRTAVEKLQNQVDVFLNCGDNVGLFPQINETVSFQNEMGHISIRGDHESHLLNGRKMEHSFTGNQSLELQRAIVTPENLRILESWPEKRELIFDGVRILLEHSLNSEHLVSGTKSIHLNLSKLESVYENYDLVCTGHTHLSHFFNTGSTTFLNPGSLGFPVNSAGRPSLAIYDTQSHEVRFAYVPFEISELKREIVLHGFNERLVAYLENGNRWQ